MFSVVAKVTAKAGNGEQLYPILKTLIAPTRSEAGCRRYDLHRRLDNSDEFLFYEIWDSQAHLEAHLKSAHFIVAYGKAEAFLAGPAEISSYSAPE